MRRNHMSDRKVFHDSVTPLPNRPGLTPRGLMIQEAKPSHRDETMTLLFSLTIPPDLEEELEKRVEKGEVLPLDELKHKYVPNSAEITALKSWLTSQGFQNIE